MALDARLFGFQDDCLIAISDGIRPDQKKLRSLPPWRAVLIARVAQKAGVMGGKEVKELAVEARRVGGDGKLSLPKGE